MRNLILSLCGVLLVASPALAMFGRPDLEKVPIGKLVDNLSKRAEEHPEDFKAWHHLARAHAMAYSKKLGDETDVSLLKPAKELWFGYLPPFVPYAQVEKSNDPAVQKRAADHLDASLVAYRRALKLQPKDATIRLGYGWCLQQEGEEAEAIKAYRIAIEQYWATDKKQPGRFGAMGTEEAARYLIPLLDKEADAEEIADLKKKILHIEGLPRAITPIAIALSPGTSLEQVVAPKASVRFDADGTGRQLKWSWITPRAGWLVYDEAGDGNIESAIQLFGNRSFMLFLDHGFEAMELLDEDGDSILRGGELQRLALWVDHDSDGRSDPGEVRSLESLGIVGLNVQSRVHTTGIRLQS